MRNKLFLFLIFFITLGQANARPPDEAELNGLVSLAEDISEWIMGFEKKPESLGIYYIHSNTPLEQDISVMTETEIMKHLAKRGMYKVSSCAECRTPNVSVSQDKVVITKGAPDTETIKKIGSHYTFDTFLMVEIFRTKFNLVAQAALYQSKEGVLISSERFSAPALSIADSSVQALFTLGLGKPLSGKGTGTSGFNFSGNLTLLEEVGFGKAGLNVGAALTDGSLIYIDPTLSFRGRMGKSIMAYAVNIGVGYGFGGDAKGFVFKGAYELFLGSFTVLGLEGIYFLPDRTTNNVTKAFAGIHIGFALGR